MSQINFSEEEIYLTISCLFYLFQHKNKNFICLQRSFWNFFIKTNKLLNNLFKTNKCFWFLSHLFSFMLLLLLLCNFSVLFLIEKFLIDVRVHYLNEKNPTRITFLFVLFVVCLCVSLRKAKVVRAWEEFYLLIQCNKKEWWQI